MTASLQNLRVGGVPEHFNMPWLLALESGAAERVGLACEWQDYATGTGAMLTDLAANELDIAILLTEGAALGLARGLPIRAVSLYTTSPLTWGVHVPAAAPWRDIGELHGRRFAISRFGSGSHLMSLALALEQGWPVDDLAFEVVNDMPGAIRALSQGEADVFLWEHFTTEPAIAAGHFRRIGDFVSPWPAWVVCARTAIWQNNRAQITALLQQVAAAAAALKNSADAPLRISRRFGLAESAVTEWLTGVDWVTDLTTPEPALEHAGKMLATAGAIPSGSVT